MAIYLTPLLPPALPHEFGGGGGSSDSAGDVPLLASGCDDKTLRLWACVPHGTGSAAAAADGSRANGTWASAAVLQGGHTGWVHCMAWSAGGGLLLPGGSGGVVALWRTPPRHDLIIAAAAAGGGGGGPLDLAPLRRWQLTDIDRVKSLAWRQPLSSDTQALMAVGGSSTAPVEGGGGGAPGAQCDDAALHALMAVEDAGAQAQAGVTTMAVAAEGGGQAGGPWQVLALMYCGGLGIWGLDSVTSRCRALAKGGSSQGVAAPLRAWCLMVCAACAHVCLNGWITAGGRPQAASRIHPQQALPPTPAHISAHAGP